MRLDHISYACTKAEFTDVVQGIGSELGATFRDGGRHPQFGTANFILPLADGRYIEVVTALDHPAAEKAAFGRAVSQRASDGGGWFSWVIAVDDISAVEERLGRPSREGHRIRPDGHQLRWKQIGVLDIMEDPQLPFFVQWLSEAEDHPSADPSAISIAKVELAGDHDTIHAFVGDAAEQFLDGIAIEWVEDEEPGIKAVWFNTPNGLVRIS